jgi:HlyD family secretion protein
MKRRNWLLASSATVVAITGFVWAFRPQPVPVQIAEVRKGLFEQTVEEDGKTRVRERYVVSAPVAGRLTRMRLKAGDLVRNGMAVASLSPSVPSMLDARTARELAERANAAQAALDAARARVGRAEAALEQARTDIRRVSKLHAEGFLAATALEQSELAQRVQAKDLEASRFAQEAAAHDLAQARAALMRAREGASIIRPGTSWEIQSPVDGRVLRVLQESETVVGIGTPLLEIADPSDLEVVIDVLSTDGVRIPAGARVALDAGADLRLAGRVRHVEPAAFTKVSALGVEEQRVNVIVDIVSAPERWRSLGDQYRVDARIVVLERHDVVIVPLAALFRDGDTWAVFVAAGNRAEKRDIAVGARTQLEAWVENGLSPAERVIIYPSDSVSDGKRVKVLQGPT